MLLGQWSSRGYWMLARLARNDGLQGQIACFFFIWLILHGQWSDRSYWTLARLEEEALGGGAWSRRMEGKTVVVVADVVLGICYITC